MPHLLDQLQVHGHAGLWIDPEHYCTTTVTLLRAVSRVFWRRRSRIINA